MSSYSDMRNPELEQEVMRMASRRASEAFRDMVCGQPRKSVTRFRGMVLTVLVEQEPPCADD